MKRNNLFFSLALVMGVSCTQKPIEPLISLWEKKIDSVSVIERTLASEPPGQCLKDIFTIETLKREVEELEKKYASGTRVSGQWKHLNLLDLPIPQANFLKTYGDQIGDLSDVNRIDFSQCQDLPCIFNRIYGKDDYVAGYVHYIWYLKFGNMLSADNRIPDQVSKNAGEYNNKKISFTNYLLEKIELYAFWRLSFMLKSPHTTLTYLTEVQKIPKGEILENAQFAGACGLASSAGWIVLTEKCLIVNEKNPDTGYLYQSVTHELTHQVDFQEGRNTKIFYRSHQQDYLALAGMSLKEFVDENGKQQRQWQHNPGIKLISNYAGTAPQENFAESLALFRVDGDHAKKQITTNHFNFVSENYFEGRSFEKEEMMKSWIEQSSQETDKAVLKAVMDCNAGGASLKSNYFSLKDLCDPTPPEQLHCLGSRATEIATLLKARISMTEPEGCEVLELSSVKDKWDNYLKNYLTIIFKKYLVDLHQDKKSLPEMKSFFEQISNKGIALKAFIACYKEPNDETCYVSKLQEAILLTSQRLNLAPEQVKALSDQYLLFNSYSLTKQAAKKYYQVFITSHLELIGQKADELWERCAGEPASDEVSPSGSYFQIPYGYMVSSFYNCLNVNINDTSKEIIHQFSVDGRKVQLGKEELILVDEARPHLIKNLQGFYLSKQEKEYQAAVEVMMNDRGAFRKKINTASSNLTRTNCIEEAYKLIPFQPLFHLKKELFSHFVETYVCSNLR